MDYQSFKAFLAPLLDSLSEQIVSSSLAPDSEDSDTGEASLVAVLQDQLEKQSFTVGVVGVFNTGKSTLLNALMGEEILSSYILPETASITTLRHGDETVSVHYWTRDEWSRLEQEASQEADSTVQQALQEVKTRFGARIEQFITPSGRTDHGIPRDQIDRYTAANSDNSHAMMVREVDVYGNFELCEENIRIVDTPGLNDPIRIREWVTEHKFLPHCDLILFLLPSGQAFTRFDRDFLHRQQAKSRLNKVFFVITKCDQLRSDRDRKAVIQWATGQIEGTLNGEGKPAQHVEVFPVSALDALFHRVPAMGESPSLSLEATGVPAFEQRLRTFLFEGERAIELQRSFLSRALSVAKGRTKRIEQVAELLGQDVETAKAAVGKKQEAVERVRRELEHVERDIDRGIRSFEKTFDSLIRELQSEIRQLDRAILEECLAELDAYLDDRNGFSAAWSIQEWTEQELSPRLTASVDERVQTLVGKMLDEVAVAAREQGEAVQASYTRAAEVAVDGDVLDLFEDGGDLLIGAAIEVAIAAALRALIPVIAAVISAELAAYLAGVLAGPIGWAIIALAGVVSLIKGQNALKDKIRTKLQAELPGQLRKPVDDTASKVGTEIAKHKASFSDQLRASLSEPSKQIYTELEALESDLASALELLGEQQGQADEKRSALEAEVEQLAAMVSTLQSHLSDVGR